MNDYDIIYKKKKNYNEIFNEKMIIIDSVFNNLIPKTDKIVDLGCGKGHYCRRYAKSGYDIVGVEPSKYCCDNFLQDIPHVESDIIEFSDSCDHYDAFLCMDVLEHISQEEIDVTISCLSKIAKFGVIGIANHNEVLFGRVLHKIRKPSEWWEKKLLESFKYVDIIGELFQKRFFIFLVKNE